MAILHRHLNLSSATVQKVQILTTLCSVLQSFSGNRAWILSCILQVKTSKKLVIISDRKVRERRKKRRGRKIRKRKTPQKPLTALGLISNTSFKIERDRPWSVAMQRRQANIWQDVPHCQEDHSCRWNEPDDSRRWPTTHWPPQREHSPTTASVHTVSLYTHKRS